MGFSKETYKKYFTEKIFAPRAFLERTISELQGGWEISLEKFDIPETEEEAKTKDLEIGNYYLSEKSDKNLRETMVRRDFSLLSIVMLIYRQEHSLKQIILDKNLITIFFRKYIDVKKISVGTLFCNKNSEAQCSFVFSLSEKKFNGFNNILRCNKLSNDIKHANETGELGHIILCEEHLRDFYKAFKSFWVYIYNNLEEPCWNECTYFYGAIVCKSVKKKYEEIERNIGNAIKNLEKSLDKPFLAE